MGQLYRPRHDGGLQTVLEKLERRMRNYLGADPDEQFADALSALRGKTLACWCLDKNGGVLTTDDPVMCHVRTLLKLAEELAGDDYPVDLKRRDRG